MSHREFLAACLVAAALACTARADIVVDFEEAATGQLVETWIEEGVVFTSTVPGGLLSFMNHSPGHRGMFEALSDIEVAIHAQLPVFATSVTIVFWGSDFQVITLKAFDNDGIIVDEVITGVPDAGLGQPAILFEMTLNAPAIASIEFTGSTANGFIAADEVRITPVPAPPAALLFVGFIQLRPRRRRDHNPPTRSAIERTSPMSRTHAIAIIVASLSLATTAAPAQSPRTPSFSPEPVFTGVCNPRCYDAIELPNVLEAAPSFAQDLNDHGQVVGVAQMTVKGETCRPWLWDAETGMQNLLPFFGFTWFASATAINNNGEVMGMYADQCFEPDPHPECPVGVIPFGGVLRGVLWATDGSGTFAEIPSVASDLGLDNLGVAPGALSNDGLIGAAAQVREPGEISFGYSLGILWDQQNDVVLLGQDVIPGATVIIVADFNDVGGYCGQVSLHGTGEARGFIYNPKTGYTVLPRLSDESLGVEQANALAINNHGQVVGHADITQIQDDVAVIFLYGAYLWDPTNGMQFLGEYTANDINDHGQIVGVQPTAVGESFPHAVLFENGAWHMLQQRTELSTVNWRLAFPQAINNNGQIAVNAIALTEAQILESGEISPFLLTPEGGPGIPGDLNNDGLVDEADRAVLCNALGTSQGEPEFIGAADLNSDGVLDELDQQLFNGILPPCAGDIVTSATFQPPADGVTDAADLAYLLGAWANQPSCADFVSSKTFQPPPDGAVDGADLAYLLGAWGACN
jgi:uncharacterized membrane protein